MEWQNPKIGGLGFNHNWSVIQSEQTLISCRLTKMVQLTDEQRTFVVKTYYETKSYIAVQQAFRVRFPNREPPTGANVHKNVQKYELKGTSPNLNKEASGRPRTGRSQQNIQLVRDAIEEDPTVSARRNGTGLPSATFNRITRLDLNLHPYTIHVRHQLQPNDYPRRLALSRWFLDKCHRDAQFLANLIIGDEAGFCLNGEVNTHNVHQYAERNHPPEFVYDRSMSMQKVTVWIGLSGSGHLFGPHFFDGNVNAQRYLDMLNDFVVPQLDQVFQRQRRGVFRRAWWAHDGAPAHGAIVVRDRLQALFGPRIIALHQPQEWPARSPDLTPCDFFLWGTLKDVVFSTPPVDLNDLRARLTDAVDSVRQDQQMIRRAVRDMERRCEVCIQRNGGHVEGPGP